jgi:hypothetical protein
MAALGRNTTPSGALAIPAAALRGCRKQHLTSLLCRLRHADAHREETSFRHVQV